MAIIPADEKVFMVDKRTNTTYGGSRALQAMQEWYTMQDVTDNIRPYKVFTAVISQSGGDDNIVNINYSTQESLIIGQTYIIDGNEPLSNGGTDFTVVGAPDNEVETSFIATGETPIWGDNAGSLLGNLSAPTATVLQNTIGNLWFNYKSVGDYQLRGAEGTFDSRRTFMNNCMAIVIIDEDAKKATCTYGSSDEIITIQTSRLTANTLENNILDGVSIEVRVYLTEYL
jgi:hypothetical protein